MGINTKQVELGRNNLASVRKFFETHLCATNRECAEALGLSAEAVGRHVGRIRDEWVSSHRTRMALVRARKVLQSKGSSKAEKCLAASVLTQRVRNKDLDHFVDEHAVRRKEKMK